MEALKKMLSKSSKIERNRRRLLNIQIQVFAWMMEVLVCVIAIFMSFAPFLKFANIISGHFAGIGYVVFVPSVYLINNNQLKNEIVESRLYLIFLDRFFSRAVNKIVPLGNEFEDNK